MRVMCIDNTAKSHPNCVGNFMVKEGSIYTVVSTFEWNGERFYIISEDPGGNGWNERYFVPLSNFDTGLLTLLKTQPKHKKKITNTPNN